MTSFILDWILHTVAKWTRTRLEWMKGGKPVYISDPVAPLTSYQNWMPLRGNLCQLKINSCSLNGRFSSIRQAIRSFQTEDHILWYLSQRLSYCRWTKIEGVGCKKEKKKYRHGKQTYWIYNEIQTVVCLENLAPLNKDQCN